MLEVKSRAVPAIIGAVVVAVLLVGALLVRRAESKVNAVALSSAPKPVTVVEAQKTTYRAQRSYVGTIEPWVQANVGPQLVSAYVDTVLVRPGAVVKRGEVLATLDCRNASATSQAVAMQARALDARQQALAHETTRVQGLLDGGFVSANEVEQKSAQTASEEAQLLATKAKLLGTSLEVNDCILRAPFDGEVSLRNIDPGGFARPGSTIVSVVDRSNVRVTADVPEVDFDAVAPSTKVDVHVLAMNSDVTATVTRRAPAADPGTRTVRIELDVPDPDRKMPVGTTAELHIEVGDAKPAAEIPLIAATVRGAKANVFVVAGDTAKSRSVHVLGEKKGRLFVDDTLAGAKVVTEGRALLGDGDRVSAALEVPASASASAPIVKGAP